MAVANIVIGEYESHNAVELQRKLKDWGVDDPSFSFSRMVAVKNVEVIRPDLILIDVSLRVKGGSCFSEN